MFEIPKYTEEEFKTYMKVRLSLFMETVDQWADSRGKDLTQEQAENMANDLNDDCYAEDEIEYLDRKYGDE